jgi:hypothetical protein
LSEENIATPARGGTESSQRFINENKLCTTHFAWQDSDSAFSVSKSNVDKVCKYILNQPEHHRKVSFQEEYESFVPPGAGPKNFATFWKAFNENKVIRLIVMNKPFSTKVGIRNELMLLSPL